MTTGQVTKVYKLADATNTHWQRMTVQTLQSYLKVLLDGVPTLERANVEVLGFEHCVIQGPHTLTEKELQRARYLEARQELQKMLTPEPSDFNSRLNAIISAQDRMIGFPWED